MKLIYLLLNSKKDNHFNKIFRAPLNWRTKAHTACVITYLYIIIPLTHSHTMTPFDTSGKQAF